MASHGDLNFDPLYPDVLGAIAGGARLDQGELQAAVGVFPRSAYYNQPIEVIVILQNMLDRPIEVRVLLTIPSKDEEGAPVKMGVEQNDIRQILQGGEVGALRIPVVPLMPTRANPAFPIAISIRSRSKGGNRVRPPTGAAPPSVLAVSPFKVQALREVGFIDPTKKENIRGEHLLLRFELASKQMPPQLTPLKPTYEALWTQAQMREERQHLVEKMDQARLVAVSFTRREIYEPLLRSTDEIFADRGIPLHPGEAKAIAKLLTYTFSDRSDTEPGYRIEDQRWFQALTQALAADEKIARWSGGDIVGRYLYESVVYDAVLLGFSLIRPKVRTNLGDKTERIDYANKIVSWLAGQIDPDLTYVYLPLILGGVTVNYLVTGMGDDPWSIIAELHEAYRGRIRLVQGSTQEIFDMLDRLLTLAEDDLKRSRILPP